MNVAKVLRRWWRLYLSAFRFVISLPRTLNVVELTIDAFSFPQHDWAKRLRRDLADDESPLTWQQALNPLYWVVWTVRFMIRWITSRPYMTLAPSVPALVVAVILMATVLSVVRRDQAATQTIYLDTLRTSIANGNTEVASVAVQRLLAIDPDNLEHQYQLAMLDDELGRKESARMSIYRLAIQEEYGPAALWMLKALVYDDPASDLKHGDQLHPQLIPRTQWSEDEKKICHRCATVAITKLPSQRAIFAKKMYARFLTQIGAAGDALALYNTIADVDPGVNLVAAQLANQLAQQTGDYLTVQRFAKAAIRMIEPVLLADPTSVPTRLNYAQALVLDEQDEQAYQTLTEGYQLTGDGLLLLAAGEARIFTAERLKRDVGARETLAERGPILYQALELAPKSPVVLEAVVQFSIECSEADDQALQNVRRKLLSGVDPPAMHFIEGTVALMSGDHESAQRHLSLAANEWKNMAGLLNNLAVTLSQNGDTAKLPQALRLSDAALDQLPGHPYLLETRGQILLRMERYEEAIVDLEAALKEPAMRPLAHPSLAIAYEKLGEDDLAGQHRRLAERHSASPQRP
ncbi:hypothetical protein NZK35_32860 [Stieleria sp. ICT_E10.1]|uniref:tetratricopeptide repeat protein n=1 Tax=Stieleria sedimenti TaxID=2976331 RepID=UPI00217FE8DE|nr:hypothetical protein [Stieleria sedimenti]MCS7471464.1 hypothetical protein [Stieleria sedimenti]